MRVGVDHYRETGLDLWTEFKIQSVMALQRPCVSPGHVPLGKCRRYRMQSRTVNEVTFNKATKENSPCLREFAFVKACGT